MVSISPFGIKGNIGSRRFHYKSKEYTETFYQYLKKKVIVAFVDYKVK